MWTKPENIREYIGWSKRETYDGVSSRYSVVSSLFTRRSSWWEHEDITALTRSQLNELIKTYEGVNIKMSKTQVSHNMNVNGGILPLLAVLALQAIPFITGTVMPALGVGSLSDLASTGVKKTYGQWFIHQEMWMCMWDRNGRKTIAFRTRRTCRRKSSCQI